MRTGFIILKRVRPNALSILCLVMACFSQAGASDNTSLQHLVAPCLACHSLVPDSTTHVGPTLAGVAGRALGTVANYTYSDAFTAKASSGLVWDRELMGQFLENPQAVVEGTAMRYTGTPDAEHRTQLLDWLFSTRPKLSQICRAPLTLISLPSNRCWILWLTGTTESIWQASA